MVGYGDDKGIIPLVTEEIFERIKRNEDKDTTFRVEASMMEIYNEQVRDLFNPKNNPTGGLKVRENPKTGPYVESLSLLPVSSYKEIEDLMDAGTRSRTVASTQMNATSSRAHTLVQVIITQTKVDHATMKATDKVSKLNLIDLAGSERAESTGATGDRLKEGCAINKSLSALGNCITALADMTDPKKKKKALFIPYRDSVLTWLLKESLGGNAKTIMIAALSPADINYEETLGTLRYADRAKQIQTKAKVNEDPNQKLIRELREEIEKLRQIAAGKIPAGGAVDAGGPASSGGGNAAADEELKRQLQESEELIKNLNKSWEEKLAEAERVKNEKQSLMEGISMDDLDPKAPHLSNLHEDPMMCGAIVYGLKEGETRLGRGSAEEPVEIKLIGLGIQPLHCTIVTEAGGEKVTLQPSERARMFHNGHLVRDPVELHHHDRLLFGQNHVFLFKFPKEVDALLEKGEDVPAPFDFENVLEELNAAQGQSLPVNADDESAKAEQLQMKLQSMEKKIRLELGHTQSLIKQQEKEFSSKVTTVRDRRDKKQQDLRAKCGQDLTEEEFRRKLTSLEFETSKQEESLKVDFEKKKDELTAKHSSLERQLAMHDEIVELAEHRRYKVNANAALLEEKLLKVIPMVNEANLMSEEMKKGVNFELNLVTRISSSADMNLPEELRYDKHVDLTIKVKDESDDSVKVWSHEKFLNRIYLIREAYQQMLEAGGGTSTEVDRESDPFWDPIEEQTIGTAMIYLHFVSHMIPVDFDTPVLDHRGMEQAKIWIELLPLDVGGNPIDEYVENPEQLIGTKMSFLLRITRATGIPKALSSNVCCRFKWYLDDEFTEVPPCLSVTINPKFEWEKLFTFDPLTRDNIEYLSAKALTVEVLGSPPLQDGGK